jgi:protein arginine kinase activator
MCEECAKKMGISESFADEQTPEDITAKTKKNTEDENLKCSSCGLTYADFKENGQLGCGDCYSAFSTPLEKVLTKLHGSTVHTGKLPFRGKQLGRVRRDIVKLRKELKAAIEREQFEQAAKLRAELATMERMAQSDN